MDEDLINYGKLIDDAMHIIVKKALEMVITQNGLPGGHHFFISFLTRYPGVQLSDKLRQKYPNEMTIVLQYQFEELQVTDEHFSVMLSFDNLKEQVIIPFAALTAFADPSVKFGLQFRYLDEEKSLTETQLEPVTAAESAAPAPEKKSTGGKKASKPAGTDNVITLDNFRKK